MTCKWESRVGLYIMVIITMLASCEANEKVSKIERKLNNMQCVEQVNGEQTP